MTTFAVVAGSAGLGSPPPSHGSQRASLTMSPMLLSRQECQERQAGRPDHVRAALQVKGREYAGRKNEAVSLAGARTS
jgi:hypothetical protein